MSKASIDCRSCGYFIRSLDIIYYNYLKLVKEKTETCRHCGLNQNINFKDIKINENNNKT